MIYAYTLLLRLVIVLAGLFLISDEIKLMFSITYNVFFVMKNHFQTLQTFFHRFKALTNDFCNKRSFSNPFEVFEAMLENLFF